VNAFIFDLDGTLLDTLADIGAACNAILAGHGHTCHDMASYRRMIGNGFSTLIRRSLPPEVLTDLKDEAIEALVREARTHYACHMYDTTCPYNGVEDTLTALAARGHRLAVLSNKPEDLTHALVTYYFPHVPFAVINGGSPHRPLKPDPGSVKDVLDCLDLGAAQCLYVGDSDVDMLTARNCGMTAVGAAWGFRGSAELRAAGAQYLVERPGDLLLLPMKQSGW